MAATGTTREVVQFLPVGAALFCIQLDFFSLSLALPSRFTRLAPIGAHQ